jgi:hypothetical protein
MPYKKGQSGNPGGKVRKLFSRLTKSDYKKFEDVRAADFVATVADHRDAPIQLRLQAAAIMVPLQETKPGDKVDPALANLGEPTTAQEALAQMPKIIASATAGKTGLDAAQKLLSMRETLIDGHIGVNVAMELDTIRAEMEALRAYAAKLIAEQTEIVGGLPDLEVGPGESPVIMSKFKRRDL